MGTMRVISVMLCAAVVPLSAGAAVVHVPGEEPTIQDGVNAAGPGDTVLVAAGTYSGQMNRNIDFGGTNLILLSEAGVDLTTIDCMGQGRGLCFRSGEDSTSVVEGFTITGGFSDDGGAVYCKASSPTLRDCVFTLNASPDDGGAVACCAGWPLIVDCVFLGNAAELGLDGAGGAILCEAGAGPTIRNCVFRGNTSDMGGAISCSDGSSPFVTYCLFDGNAGDSGGVLASRSGSAPVIEKCTMAGNLGGAGSAIYCDGISSVTVETTIIAFGYKGQAATCSPGGTATLTCSDVYGNECGDWSGCIAGQNGANGNISLDPLFCGHLNPEERYSLRSDSPCAPQNNPGCGGMGALGVGCEPSPVEATSWGCLKALFR